MKNKILLLVSIILLLVCVGCGQLNLSEHPSQGMADTIAGQESTNENNNQKQEENNNFEIVYGEVMLTSDPRHSALCEKSNEYISNRRLEASKQFKANIENGTIPQEYEFDYCGTKYTLELISNGYEHTVESNRSTLKYKKKDSPIITIEVDAETLGEKVYSQKTFGPAGLLSNPDNPILDEDTIKEIASSQVGSRLTQMGLNENDYTLQVFHSEQGKYYTVNFYSTHKLMEGLSYAYVQLTEDGYITSIRVSDICIFDFSSYKTYTEEDEKAIIDEALNLNGFGQDCRVWFTLGVLPLEEKTIPVVKINMEPDSSTKLVTYSVFYLEPLNP